MAQDRLEGRRCSHLGSHRTLPELQYRESATTPGVSAAVQLVGSCIRVIELAGRPWGHWAGISGFSGFRYFSVAAPLGVARNVPQNAARYIPENGGAWHATPIGVAINSSPGFQSPR